jgi:hypothetical protein
MKYQLILRYQKRSDYDDYVFLADPDKEDEVKSYEKLKDLSEKLAKSYDTYLPIFHSEDHNVCSIRFKKDEGKDKKFKKNSLYTIDFILKKKEYKEQQYINCWMKKHKLHSKQEVESDGEIMDEL